MRDLCAYFYKATRSLYHSCLRLLGCEDFRAPRPLGTAAHQVYQRASVAINIYFQKRLSPPHMPTDRVPENYHLINIQRCVPLMGPQSEFC
jgi:hypothetical protein